MPKNRRTWFRLVVYGISSVITESPFVFKRISPGLLSHTAVVRQHLSMWG